MHPKTRMVNRFALLVAIVALFVAASRSNAGSDPVTHAATWQEQTIVRLRQQLQNGASDQGAIQELKARLAWLSQWEPQRNITFDLAKVPEIRSPWLVAEPVLAERLERSLQIARDDQVLETLKSIASMQAELHRIDAPKVRKKNLLQTALLCERMVQTLRRWRQEHPEFLQSGLVTIDDLHWLELHTRYRMGRAIGYRELPDVLEEIPIRDFPEHDARLRKVYRELVDAGGGKLPEFVLLEVRMLRRDRRFGQALQMLDAFRWGIEDRWYLKKRRDILRKLKWEPAADQASAAYDALLAELNTGSGVEE